MNPIEYRLPKIKSKYALGINLDSFQKPQLEQFATRLKKCVEKAPYRVSDDSDKGVARTFKMLMGVSASQLRKPELMDVLVSFYHTPANMFALIEETAPKFKEIWTDLLWSQGMTLADVEKKSGVLMKLIETVSWHRERLVHPLLMGVDVQSTGGFYISRTEKSDRLRVSLPAVVKQMAVNILEPEEIKAYVTETLPEGLETRNLEQDLTGDLMQLNVYAAGNDLLGTSENVSLTKVKSVARKINMDQFADYGKDTLLSRPHLMALVYVSMLLHNRRHGRGEKVYDVDSVGAMGRYAIESFGSELGTTAFRMLLPEYEGITKTMVNDSRARLIYSLVKTLLESSKDGWLEMRNFQKRYIVQDSLVNDGGTYTALFSPHSFNEYALQRGDMLPNQGAGERAQVPPRMWEDLTWRFVRHLLRLFEALGIIEIAGPAEGDRLLGSDERLRESYVRMTRLGRYAYGFERKYTPQIRETEGEDLDIDDRNMIITVLNEHSPSRVFVEAYGRAIGGHRYHFTAAGLAAGAMNSLECRRRVENLRSILKGKAGPVWERMLAECELRAETRLSDNTQYVLLRLNPNTPGLMELISRRPELLSRVIKAEGGRLLVPLEDFSDFKKALKKEGYLLD